jgi:hypothetical protein
MDEGVRRNLERMRAEEGDYHARSEAARRRAIPVLNEMRRQLLPILKSVPEHIYMKHPDITVEDRGECAHSDDYHWHAGSGGGPRLKCGDLGYIAYNPHTDTWSNGPYFQQQDKFTREEHVEQFRYSLAYWLQNQMSKARDEYNRRNAEPEGCLSVLMVPPLLVSSVALAHAVGWF